MVSISNVPNPSPSSSKAIVSILATPQTQKHTSMEQRIIKQLHQDPIKMYLYDLIQISPNQRKSLIENLHYIPITIIEPQPFITLIEDLTNFSTISFNTYEILYILPKGYEIPIFITIYINETFILWSMINNGDSINII